MPDNRYMKLNLAWSDSEWVSGMSEGGRLCWIYLIGYCKSFGLNGRVKSVSESTFARKHDVSENSIRECLNAAIVHGAVRVKVDTWVFDKWAKHQGDETGAERQRRFKQRQKGNGGNAFSPFSNTEEKRREESIPPISPNGGGRRVIPSLEEWTEYATKKGLPEPKAKEAWHYYDSNGWLRAGRQPIVKWKGCVATCLLRYEESLPKAGRLPRASQVGEVT